MTLARCTVPPVGPAAEAAWRHRAALPVIETERLVLRAPSTVDYPLWLRIFTEPGCEFIHGPVTPERAWYDFCGYVACWLLHGHGPFVLRRRSGDGGDDAGDDSGLGFVFLGYEWDDEEPELGWFLAREARGQGYAREAVAAVRDWGLGLMPEFVSCVDPSNAPSTALARRLGAALDRQASALHGIGIWRHRPSGLGGAA
jgi:RimJ/RimL family protein N-acetyltransferase